MRRDNPGGSLCILKSWRSCQRITYFRLPVFSTQAANCRTTLAGDSLAGVELQIEPRAVGQERSRGFEAGFGAVDLLDAQLRRAGERRTKRHVNAARPLAGRERKSAASRQALPCRPRPCFA